MITNAKRGVILLIYYSISALIGIILSMIGSECIYWSLVLCFNAANGLLSFAFFKRLKLHALIKLALFTLAVIVMVYLYKILNEYSNVESIAIPIALLTNIAGVLVLGISRITLTKSRPYFVINFMILPIACAVVLLFSLFELVVGIIGAAILVIIACIFIWYAGSQPHYESGHYTYTYETSDGRTIRHAHDNVYTDDCGHFYELTGDGKYLSEI